MLKLKQKLNKLVKKAKLKKSACFSYYKQKTRLIAEMARSNFSLGLLKRQQAEMLMLVCSITFTGYIILFKQHCAEIYRVPESHFEVQKPIDFKKEQLTKDLQTVVKGSPIEMMIPYIATKDRKTAAYLIGIAKKESNWGNRKPVLNGQDCYNYWGFRAQRERMGSGGHTCFDNPREAVDVVSKRIAEIIDRNDVESAKDMLVWKCGSNCAVTGGQIAADKWASDVDLYAGKVLN